MNGDFTSRFQDQKDNFYLRNNTLGSVTIFIFLWDLIFESGPDFRTTFDLIKRILSRPNYLEVTR